MQSSTTSVAASGGVGAAADTVLTWLLSLFHVVVPPEVQGAGFVLLTWAAGKMIHALPTAKIAEAPPSAGFAIAPIAVALVALGLLLMLPGCAGFDAAWSGANNYYNGQLQATVKNIQGVNDNAAKTWADAGCATPYGELVRNGSGNPNLPAAVIALCGLPPGYTVVHAVSTATVTTGPANITIPTSTTTVTGAPPTP